VGFVLSAAEFYGHRNPVICMSSDPIPGGNTDVIASCDSQGNYRRPSNNLFQLRTNWIRPNTGMDHIQSRSITK
jgi:hypothetical protein